MEGAWAKMEEYRKRGLFADVNFSVGGKDFAAHKVVLSSQSTVFEAMFTSGLEESLSGQVNIVDIKPDVFEVLLTFFYTHAVSESALNTHLEELYYCAEKYAVPQLTDVCSQYLENSCTVVRRLFLANTFSLSRLKTEASKEIAESGWEKLSPGEWFELFSDFPLTTEVLLNVIPSFVEVNYVIKPDMWFSCVGEYQTFMTHLPPLRLRNNGRPCEVSVTLRCCRKTIKCFFECHHQKDGPRVVEMSFAFSIGNIAHFCGKGDVWWDLADMVAGTQEACQDIFEHTFSLNNAIRNTTLEFNLTVKQWSPPVPQLPTDSEPINSDSVDLATVHISCEIFYVNKDFVCRESEIFKKLMLEERSSYELEHIDVDSFRKINNYLCSGIAPLQKEVDLPMILCANSLGLTNLVKYCEQILAQSLVDSSSPETLGRAVDLLIIATDNNFELLCNSALSNIDFNLKNVINSDSWARLKDRPDLLFSIVRKMFTHPCWSDSSDSDTSCDSEKEIESIMDSVD